MKRFKDWSFQNKLFFVNLLIVLLVVFAITTVMTQTAARLATNSNFASLNLVTEQALINFSTSTASVQSHLYTTSVSCGTAQQMKSMLSKSPDSIGYPEARQALILALSRMVDTGADYDYVTVRLEDGRCFSSDIIGTQAAGVSKEAEQLLSQPEYSQKQYGRAQWVRTGTGNLFLLRDVYATSPLKYVGRIAARIRKNALVDLGQYNQTLHCGLLFFDEHDTLVSSVGLDESDDLLLLAKAGVASALAAAGKNYTTCTRTYEGWQAVGLLPISVVNEVRHATLRSGVLVALLGALCGLIVARVMGHRMSRQVRELVTCMNQVAGGDLSVVMPIESHDDIGILTEHFNQMTDRIRSLLDKVVQEENRKGVAEYQTLEYRYRFLQWQINPHFIYNALETVNAHAKLDGNPELSEMITMLSAYFRQNAEAMRRRFSTVRCEFQSLRQYVEIYRHIYGDALRASFDISPGAEEALVPTMIMQPILENALIHGKVPHADRPITARAVIDGDRLVISIRDQGHGMSEETIERILRTGPQKEEAGENDRASLGVRNVLDRMRLLYGDEASMSIESELNVGTCVTVSLPLTYHQAAASEEI